MMDYLSKELVAYCTAHTGHASKVLQELERETHLKTIAPQMISGHLQGQLLSFISKMIRPEAILEIGTFTGYSAICLAQGLKEKGVLHTIEAEEELVSIINKYLEKAGLMDVVQLHIGDAREIIPTLNPGFDIVFIDAEKTDYSLYYELVFDKLKAGGFLVADNVLWNGKVLQKEQDEDTRAICRFNEKVKRDNRMETLMLPVRDGLLLARKVEALDMGS